MDVISRKITELIPYVNNARTHSADQVTKIASSIKEFGFTNPVLIDGDNGIMAGHGRVQAAIKLNMTEVPTIALDSLTKPQIKAYILADNRLAEDAGWNMDLVSLELKELQELDFDIDLTGFGLDDIILDNEGLTDDDEVPEAPKVPVSKLGDVWLLGNHRLMCGSSTSVDNVEKLMDGQKDCFVFSDPPYGIDVVQSNQVGGSAATKFGTADSSNIVESSTYSKIIGDETIETAKEFYNTCISIGMKNILLWGGNYFTEFLYPSRCWVVWDKEMTGNFSQAEMAWTSFSKGGIKVFKHLWNGLSREGNRKDELKKRVHPTQKPVGLFVEIFNRFDGFKEIYDGFGGSGSTLIACEKTNRNCFMMELDEKYCDVIIKRWQDYTGNKAILESTGIEYCEAA